MVEHVCTRQEYERITGDLYRAHHMPGWLPDSDGRLPPRLHDTGGPHCYVGAATLRPLYTTAQKAQGMWIPDFATMFFLATVLLTILTTSHANDA